MLGAQTFLSSEQKVIEEARKALRAENAERGESLDG